MSDLNNCTFTGRLVKDAVHKKFPTSGIAYCTFSIANNTGYGDYESAQFFNCKLIGKRAESLKPYLIKGQMVGVTGELTANNWTKDDGTQVKDWQLTLNNLQLLGSKRNKEQAELFDDEPEYEVIDNDLDAKLKGEANKRYKNFKEEVAF